MKALKVRIYPTSEQVDFLNQQFGAVRKVWNMGLAILNNRYKRHHQSLSAYHDLKKLLPIAKRSRKYAWLKTYDSTALQEALRNLDKAMKKFFNKKAGYPHFKSKHNRQSSYHCSATVAYTHDSITIGKLEKPIKAKIHRKVDHALSSITISREPSGKYYASLCFKQPSQAVETKFAAINQQHCLGLDVGLTHLLIDSNGKKIDNPRFLRNATKNLRRKQKALSRKAKGSASRNKARLLVAKSHERLRHARDDFQHKISKTIVDENQAVMVETLKIKNMIKNRKLAKHIADASWGKLIEKIEYKAKQASKPFIKIDQWFASSKTCHVCHHKVDDMPLNIRKWDCPSCKTTSIDRDINAAINIKHQGITILKAAGLSVSAN